MRGRGRRGTHDERSRGRVYGITGPELIDARRYLALFEEFGGRGIVHADANVDDADYERYGAAFAAGPDNAAYFELFTRHGPRNPDRLSEPSRDWTPATHRPAPTLHARALPTPPLVAPHVQRIDGSHPIDQPAS